MKKELITAGLASLLFAACTNDSTEPVTLATSELGVSINIAAAVSSRALTDAFATSDAIGVFIKGTGYTPHVATYLCSANGAGSEWTAPTTETDKIYLANEEATVYAFYPSTAVISNSSDNAQSNYYTAVQLTIPSTQQFAAADVNDYMYATTREGDGSTTSYTYPLALASNADADGTSVYDNKVDLYMHHALTKLSFVMNKNASYAGTGILSKITLSTTVPVQGSPKFQADGTLTMSVVDGTISGTAASDLLTISGTDASDTKTINAASTPASTVVTTTALVAPLSDVSGITLTLTIDGKSMCVELPHDAANNSDKWLSEKNYTYTITVKSTELVVSSVSIVSWGEIAAGNADIQ